MRLHGRLGCVTIALAAAVGPAACGAQPATPPTPAVVPAAAGAQPARATERLGDPAPEPTIAKNQKWVRIFSGPSVRDVTPPWSITTGSRTVELNATLSTQFGAYVSDGAGRTLYRFDGDSADPSRSTCDGACAKTWPPLLIRSPGKIFPNGMDPEILGYVERADGHCQVTINGRPVYYFAGDERPGDVRGQGVKGTWFAVSPAGGRTRNLLD